MYKAGDFTNGKMNEIFKSANGMDGALISHKQHGNFVLISEDRLHSLAQLILESRYMCGSEVNDDGGFSLYSAMDITPDDAFAIGTLTGEMIGNSEYYKEYGGVYSPEFVGKYMSCLDDYTSDSLVMPYSSTAIGHITDLILMQSALEFGFREYTHLPPDSVDDEAKRIAGYCGIDFTSEILKEVGITTWLMQVTRSMYMIIDGGFKSGVLSKDIDIPIDSVVDFMSEFLPDCLLDMPDREIMMSLVKLTANESPLTIIKDSGNIGVKYNKI